SGASSALRGKGGLRRARGSLQTRYSELHRCDRAQFAGDCGSLAGDVFARVRAPRDVQSATRKVFDLDLSDRAERHPNLPGQVVAGTTAPGASGRPIAGERSRSEEHTSEL